MSVKLVEPINNDVAVDDMRDGEIAIIRRWLIPSGKNVVVQRYGNDLISLGSPQANGWKNYFRKDSSINDNLVEILNPGTHLVIR